MFPLSHFVCLIQYSTIQDEIYAIRNTYKFHSGQGFKKRLIDICTGYNTDLNEKTSD